MSPGITISDPKAMTERAYVSFRGSSFNYAPFALSSTTLFALNMVLSKGSNSASSSPGVTSNSSRNARLTFDLNSSLSTSFPLAFYASPLPNRCQNFLALFLMGGFSAVNQINMGCFKWLSYFLVLRLFHNDLGCPSRSLTNYPRTLICVPTSSHKGIPFFRIIQVIHSTCHFFLNFFAD